METRHCKDCDNVYPAQDFTLVNDKIEVRNDAVRFTGTSPFRYVCKDCVEKLEADND